MFDMSALIEGLTAVLFGLTVQHASPLESEVDRLERIRGIASAIVLVSFDDSERPLVRGAFERARTAALVAAVAIRESDGFARDVDLGPCDRRGNSRRCDSGRSACLMQIHLGKAKTAEGWTQRELFADRAKCFRAGLHLMRSSWWACARGQELNVYASGRCSFGDEITRDRVRLGARIFNEWRRHGLE